MLIAHSDSLVEPQTPDIIEHLVRNFLNAEFAKLNSKNKMDVSLEVGALPWVGNKDHWNFRAADAATQVGVVWVDSINFGPCTSINLCFPDRLRGSPRP